MADKKAKIKTEATRHDCFSQQKMTRRHASQRFSTVFAWISMQIVCRGHVPWIGSHAERHSLHGQQGEPCVFECAGGRKQNPVVDMIGNKTFLLIRSIETLNPPHQQCSSNKIIIRFHNSRLQRCRAASLSTELLMAEALLLLFSHPISPSH